jgi:hypothetical protein
MATKNYNAHAIILLKVKATSPTLLQCLREVRLDSWRNQVSDESLLMHWASYYVTTGSADLKAYYVTTGGAHLKAENDDNFT